jgi:hypothetical protein
MTGSGFIHFDCYCGADLYYMVSQPDDDKQKSAKKALSSLINHPHFAIYTDLDGISGDCPHCGALVELPDPETVNFLRHLSWTRLERESIGGISSDITRDWLSSTEYEYSNGSNRPRG